MAPNIFSVPRDALVIMLHFLRAAQVALFGRTCTCFAAAVAWDNAFDTLVVNTRAPPGVRWDTCTCTHPRKLVVKGGDGRDDMVGPMAVLRRLWSSIEELHLNCAWHGWMLPPQHRLRRLLWTTPLPHTGGPVPAAILHLVPDVSHLVELHLPCLRLQEPYHARLWTGAARLARARFERVQAAPSVVHSHFHGFPALRELRVGRALLPGICVDGCGLLAMIAASRAPLSVTLADTPLWDPTAFWSTAAWPADVVEVLDGFGRVRMGACWLGVWRRIRNLTVHNFGEDAYFQGVSLASLLAAAAGRVTGVLRVRDLHKDRLERTATSEQASRMSDNRNSIPTVHVVSGDEPWEDVGASQLAELLVVGRRVEVRLATVANYWQGTQDALEAPLVDAGYLVSGTGERLHGAHVVATVGL